MLRNLLILPDGSELFSGTGTEQAVRAVTLTQCVNADRELTLGSVCACRLEAAVFAPGGLALTAGDQVRLYKVDDAGTRYPVGIFILEEPIQTSPNTMKLFGYDRMTLLDRDLTQWLSSLTGWPYNILDFAGMVCSACGVSFTPTQVPNGDYAVEKFTASGVTGRQLMKWIGEVTCSFCRADAAGDIRLDWYQKRTTHVIGYREGLFDEILYDYGTGDVSFVTPDVTAGEADGAVTLDSDRFTVTDDGAGNVTVQLADTVTTLPYFQNGLRYEAYRVQPVDAVQLQLSSGETGYRWPTAAADANCYVITGNPMLSKVSEPMAAVLENIRARLADVSYTPCKVTLQADIHVTAGDILSLTDKNGKTVTVYVMTATTAGQKLTLECTGSYRRDSTTAQSELLPQQVAQQVVNAQTQQDIFNKLTENGTLQGLYMQDGQLYINASYLKAGTLDAALIRVVNLVAEKLQSAADNSLLTVDGAVISLQDTDVGETFGVRNYPDGTAYLYMRKFAEDGTDAGRCQLGANRLYLGGTWAAPVFGLNIVNGGAVLALDGVSKQLYWHKNADGTYTLMGK